MPFTPFHLGPGLLVKAGVPRHFSFSAFVLTQVVIDVESLYHLVRQDWPVHRVLHTFLLGSIVGIGVGLAAYAFARSLSFVDTSRLPIGLQSEITLVGAVAGGWLGGFSHALLDGLMHTDIQPLQPFAQSNPFLGLVTLGVLHAGCLVAGVAGLLVLSSRARLWRVPF